MKYLIYVNNVFGKEVWTAPNENAKECMLKSAKEFGIEVVKVEQIN